MISSKLPFKFLNYVYEPHPALSKGEGSKIEFKILSFGVGYCMRLLCFIK